jgi:hypothetical protein
MTHLDNKRMWQSRVADFKASNQSVAAWCAAHDVKTHQLRYWIRKFNTSDNETQTTSVQWISVEMGERHTSGHPNTLPIRIGQATIEVRPGFDPTLLAEVVRTLAIV